MRQLFEATAPLTVEYRPDAQLAHAEAPTEAAKVPATQLVQVLEDEAPVVAENEPAAHAEQLDAPVLT